MGQTINYLFYSALPQMWWHYEFFKPITSHDEQNIEVRPQYSPAGRKVETEFTSAVNMHKPASQLKGTAFLTRLITQRFANEWFEGLFIPFGLQISCQQMSVCVIITFRLLFHRTIYLSRVSLGNHKKVYWSFYHSCTSRIVQSVITKLAGNED